MYPGQGGLVKLQKKYVRIIRIWQRFSSDDSIKILSKELLVD